jgi:hypothetical protein
MVQGQLGQIVRPYLKNIQYRAGGAAQMIKHLPNPSTTTTNKKKIKRKMCVYVIHKEKEH